MNLGNVLAPRVGSGAVYPPEAIHRELLVHNVSHSDLIVALRVPVEMRSQQGDTRSFTTLPGTDLEPCVLARPKFSSFDYVASTIRERVASAEHEGSLRDCIMDSEQGVRTRVGFSFAGSPVALRGWTDFHIKGTTAELPETAYKSAPEVVCVYLPLAAVLIPRWLGVVRSFGTPCALWLYLVSGSGTPHNPDHPVTGNSTVAVSGLIDSFVRRVAPEVTVQRIHSGPGVFRYHDNVTFVNNKLQPVVERHHREMCSTGDEEWHKRIHIKMTLADGATARVTALTHAMRRYRPDFFHVWQLKSFWHYQRVDELDVDFIRFSRVDTMPPVLRDSLSADARLLVDEMRAFYASFQAAASHVDDTELARFWLRKTRKPVLAVLLVQKLPDGEPRLYRGINMEVSMPTGSLCAERNVIGTALSSDLRLKRQDLRMIAVLGVGLPNGSASPQSRLPSCPASARSSEGDRARDARAGMATAHYSAWQTTASGRASRNGPLWPADGAATEREEVAEEGEEDRESLRSTPMASSKARAAAVAAADAVEPEPRVNGGSRRRQGPAAAGGEAEAETGGEEGSPPRKAARGAAESVTQSLGEGGAPSMALPPPKQPQVPKRRRASSIDDGSLRNPMEPCGACTEWLRKVAEVNPDFKVVTFTDSTLDQVFVKPVQL